MTYEPRHSAQAQSVRVKEKYLLDLLVIIATTLQSRSEDKCIFYPYFRVKSLRFGL